MATLRIFLVERTDQVDYDEPYAHVIASHSKTEARIIAFNRAIDENAEVWKDAKITEIGIYTGDKQEPHIIITDRK